MEHCKYYDKETVNKFSLQGKMLSTWHQLVFSLDVKYNQQYFTNRPTLGILYIRRRSQLLRDKFPTNPELRSKYLKIRSELLNLRYGENTEKNSSWNISTNRRMLTKTFESVSRKSVADNFAFAGVHHVFDQHKAAITTLKFANNDRSKLCSASLDGFLFIYETINAPIIKGILKGHSQGVTGFDWSSSNDLIVSSSLDTTVRLWKIHTDKESICLRVVHDRHRTEVLCCAFIPTNNNFIITGNAQGYLQILNISTGIYSNGGSARIDGKILSLICEESGGSLLWAGNDRGTITSFRLESGTGQLTKLRKVQDLGGMITSLSWRSWLSNVAPSPALLVSASCNAVFLYRIVPNRGTLTILKKYPIKHKQHFVKSTFCSQTGASLIATGSEDGDVHLLDSEREGRASKINRLHGHASPTLALAFNYDESLLASADYQGLIILWRNHQRDL